jgi:hypothetical protein
MKQNIASLAVFVLGLSFASSAFAQEPSFPEVDGLQITELTLARGVENGRAVDATSSFARTDQKLYVLVRLNNATRAASEITVSFERVGATRQLAGRTLTVAAQARYRTVARTSPGIYAPGRYRAVVRTADGETLGEVEFDVT